MKSKFIIKAGQHHYGSGFHVNSRTRKDWPKSFLTTNIDEARVFDTVGTAKAMSTRLQGVLKEWVKVNPSIDPRVWEPIIVQELNMTVGKTIFQKPSVLEELQ